MNSKGMGPRTWGSLSLVDTTRASLGAAGNLLHGAPFLPVVLASVFLTSLAWTLSRKSFLHWLCLTCSTRTQILLGRILPRTRLFTTTPTARLDTLKTRPVLPW